MSEGLLKMLKGNTDTPELCIGICRRLNKKGGICVKSEGSAGGLNGALNHMATSTSTYAGHLSDLLTYQIAVRPAQRNPSDLSDAPSHAEILIYVHHMKEASLCALVMYCAQWSASDLCNASSHAVISTYIRHMKEAAICALVMYCAQPSVSGVNDMMTSTYDYRAKVNVISRSCGCLSVKDKNSASMHTTI